MSFSMTNYNLFILFAFMYLFSFLSSTLFNATNYKSNRALRVPGIREHNQRHAPHESWYIVYWNYVQWLYPCEKGRRHTMRKITSSREIRQRILYLTRSRTNGYGPVVVRSIGWIVEQKPKDSAFSSLPRLRNRVCNNTRLEFVTNI